MRKHRTLAAVLVSLLCGVTAPAAQSTATPVTAVDGIVRIGETATPNAGVFSQVAGAQINNAGDIVVLGLGRGAESFAVYLSEQNPSQNPTHSLLAITGSPITGMVTTDGLPVTVVIPWHLARLNFQGIAPGPDDILVINDRREVAFAAALDGGFPLLDVVLKWRNGELRKVAAIGDATPIGGSFSEVWSPSSMNTAGDVVFRSAVSSASGVREAIFVGTNTGIAAVVTAGDVAPSGGTFISFRNDRGAPVYMPATINDRGDVFFWAALSGDGPAAGLFLKSAESGQVRTIALEGHTGPDGEVFHSFVAHIRTNGIVTFDTGAGRRLNSGGVVVFVAFTGERNGLARPGVYRWQDDTITQIARADEQQFVHCWTWTVDHPTINDAGAVAFRRGIECPVDFTSHYTIVEDSFDASREVISTRNTPPTWRNLANPLLNNRGDVLFAGSGLNGETPFAGLFLASARDETPPSIESSVAPAANASGWHNQPVSVEWFVDDPESGIADANGCETRLLTEETAAAAMSCTATNGVGLSASAAVLVKIDLTDPSIVFTGNRRIYTVDQMVAISCAATEALSGIANGSCPSITAAAFTFDIGTTVLAATATDAADNSHATTTSFDVRVTFASLANLTRQFSINTRLATTLAALLDVAAVQDGRGNVRTRKPAARGIHRSRCTAERSIIH